MICEGCNKDRKRLNKDGLCISCEFSKMFSDPEMEAKARAFVRATTPTDEDLNRPFTR